MEHYDWNDGWLFAPTFDPAIVRPECTGVELEPVRLPHTVKTLPYNYCNENEYQRVSGYRREFFAPKEWQGRTVLLPVLLQNFRATRQGEKSFAGFFFEKKKKK